MREFLLLKAFWWFSFKIDLRYRAYNTGIGFCFYEAHSMECFWFRAYLAKQLLIWKKEIWKKEIRRTL